MAALIFDILACYRLFETCDLDENQTYGKRKEEKKWIKAQSIYNLDIYDYVIGIIARQFNRDIVWLF